MKTTQVVGAVALALVVGAVGGILISRTPVDPCLNPTDHVIDVDARGGLSCPDAVVKWKVNRVVWNAPSGSTLTIRFRSTSVTQPVCSGNACMWGPPTMANPSTQPYDYDVGLTASGPPTQTNGRIIIQK